jgi:hypothetical protein
MSWSYRASGAASNVRAQAAEYLAQCAASCAKIPAEVASIESFAKAVDAACEAADGQAVIVQGHGSAWLQGDLLRSYSFEAKIEVIDLQGS